MYYLDPKGKRAHTIRLFIGYFLMAIVLAISTLLVVLITNGYDVDRKTGGVIQNGLIVVGSNPIAGNVFVNGDPSGRATRRLVLPASKYLIEIKRDGYRDWKRDIDLSGSVIEQLVYPFLFPENLETRPIASYPIATDMFSQSPDRRWLIVNDKEKLGIFDVIDLSEGVPEPVAIALPVDTVSPANGEHAFKEVEWSTDNNSVLLKHSWSTGSEYIVLNVSNPLASLNISKLFSTFPGFEVSLFNKTPDQFYLYNPNTLSLVKAEVKDKRTEAVPAKVVQFKGYKDDTVVYVNDKKELRIKKNENDYLVRSEVSGDKYLLDYASFDNNEYLVVGSLSDTKTYVYKDPLESLEYDATIPPSPFRALNIEGQQFVSFSSNTRFIAVQGGPTIEVLDFETNRQYRYDTSLELAKNERFLWMDGHRLTSVSDGKMQVFDFNGLNLQTLTSADPSTRAYFDRDYEAMFTISTTDKTKQIIRTELLVK